MKKHLSEILKTKIKEEELNQLVEEISELKEIDTLQAIEDKLISVKDKKNRWKYFSALLNICQAKDLFVDEYINFTKWVNSLDEKMGLKRSTLIREKSAGEHWLFLEGINSPEDILACPVNDSGVLTGHKSVILNIEKGKISVDASEMEEIRVKLLKGDVLRSEIDALGKKKDSNTAKIKTKLKELKVLLKTVKSKEIEGLVSQMEEELKKIK